jgi:hypothetical protein
MRRNERSAQVSGTQQSLRTCMQRQPVPLPVRLLPSRRPRYGVMLFLIGALVFALCTAYAARPLDLLSIIALSCFVALLFWPLIREALYLRTDGRYWLEITRDRLCVSTPIMRREVQWSDLAPFTFEIEEGDGPFFGIVQVRSSDQVFKIEADDFASDLRRDKKSATEIFCEFLNQVRSSALAGDFDRSDAKLEAPAGLRTRLNT